MTIYLEAITRKRKPLIGKSIFLAGGISNCWNWQINARNTLMKSKAFDYVVNPRRENFDILNEAETPKQIKWEHQYLAECSHIMFWFTEDTIQPITLFELGRITAGDKKIYIGCNLGYSRRLDVVEQMKLYRPDLKVHDSLDKLLEYIISDNLPKTT